MSMDIFDETEKTLPGSFSFCNALCIFIVTDKLYLWYYIIYKNT